MLRHVGPAATSSLWRQFVSLVFFCQNTNPRITYYYSAKGISFHLNLETAPLPLTDVCSKSVEFQRHANISGQRCHRLFLSDRVLQRVLHSYCLFSRCMNCDFCPRDAMLARVLATYDLVSVSVCHKSVFYQNGWTNRAGFGTGASFHLSYTVFYRNIGVFKNKGTSLWNFDPNSGFEKNRHSISHRTWSSAAGKVTVGLASHWPCVTDSSVFSTYSYSVCPSDDFVARVN